MKYKMKTICISLFILLIFDYDNNCYGNDKPAGIATVSFYNNGTCKGIDISGEGLTNDGRIISSENNVN